MEIVIGLSKAKCEGRKLVDKVIDNWEWSARQVYDATKSYWELVGGDDKTSAVLLALSAPARTLQQESIIDTEDERIAVGQYVYQLYCGRLVMGALGSDLAAVVGKFMESHFWYVLGELRGSGATIAKRQLENKLKFTGMSLSEFMEMVE